MILYMIAERFRENPMPGFVGLIAIVPAAVWIYFLVSGMVMDEIEVGPGLFALLMTVVALFFTLTPAFPAIAYSGALLLFITPVAYPITRGYFNQQGLAKIEQEQITKSYESLERKPDNVIAKFRIAEGLYASGYAEQAIAVADATLKNLPKDAFRHECRTLEIWRRETNRKPIAASIECMSCRAQNSPDQMHCLQCGARYLQDYSRGKVVSGLLARRFICGWAVGVVGFLGIPLVSFSEGLEGAARGGAIAGLVVILAGLIYIGFWPRKGVA